MFAYDWDLATDIIVRSGDVAIVPGSTAEVTLSRQPLPADIRANDKASFSDSMAERTPENPDIQTSHRLLHPDGSVQWLADTAHAFFDENGHLVRSLRRCPITIG